MLCLVTLYGQHGDLERLANIFRCSGQRNCYSTQSLITCFNADFNKYGSLWGLINITMNKMMDVQEIYANFNTDDYMSVLKDTISLLCDRYCTLDLVDICITTTANALSWFPCQLGSKWQLTYYCAQSRNTQKQDYDKLSPQQQKTNVYLVYGNWSSRKDVSYHK